MLSADTDSLRHLPRRSSENCDLQFANADRQLKENYSIDDFCPLPDPDVGLSIFACDVEHTSFHLVYAAARLLCACLVSVQVSAPYVIAGSTQELYPCLFRQMARLLLKMSRCLAHAAQPAMVLRCISLSRFFSLRRGCSVVPSTRSLGHFLSAH